MRQSTRSINRKNNTSLCGAVWRCHLGKLMQKYLNETGVAKIDETDDEGKTPLYMAVTNGNLGMVKAILRLFRNHKKTSGAGTSLTKKEESGGGTPLHRAMELNDEAMKKVMLLHLEQTEDSAALEIPDGQGVAPLHYLAAFASEAHMELMLKLLEKTSDEALVMRDARVDTPLHWMARQNK
ncbi:Ankyrin repeat-containing domain protein [Cordyceps fumosorosea ARSEF 2679]|uniref:Ankyrin repeat-containing domain protein n=1 Tax=Cordyceps fumosorosea (strain ARSEF 2679) TaxID=1081104 RepID=A0A162MLT6_CORFA|nr:Ankyrin repeat-containing domain protein [Cordyceps fumosorosea ARSEF 2679]OAA63890.1 Ankyrin repeat-containing domain protein [Cordyceps fumosorosea ARSEF 2679]